MGKDKKVVDKPVHVWPAPKPDPKPPAKLFGHFVHDGDAFWRPAKMVVEDGIESLKNGETVYEYALVNTAIKRRVDFLE